MIKMIRLPKGMPTIVALVFTQIKPQQKLACFTILCVCHVEIFQIIVLHAVLFVLRKALDDDDE